MRDTGVVFFLVNGAYFQMTKLELNDVEKVYRANCGLLNLKTDFVPSKIRVDAT